MKKRRSFLRRSSKAKNEEGEASAMADAAAKVAALENDDDGADMEKKAESLHEKAPPANDSSTPGDNQQSTPDSRGGFMSINQACEEIWKCTGAKETASLLQVLHTALLRTPLKDYVPSDVFVCISGAALRFHTDGDDDETDFELLWQVREEAMWAAAALARVCVGAAWRSQLKQRSEWIQQKKQANGDSQHRRVASEGGSPPSSSSPSRGRRSMPFLPVDSAWTQSNTANSNPFDSARSVYPPIPENLPAAMLRFAAMEMLTPTTVENNDQMQRWIDRRKSLAEAQRELVLALCYILPEEEPDDPETTERRLEWTILEAHEPVACMVNSWLKSAATNWRSSTQFSIEKGIESSVDEKPTAVPSDNNEDVGKNAIGSGEPIPSRRSSDGAGTNAHDHSENRVPLHQPDGTEACPSVDYKYSSNVDWWTALQVVRATFQLVSAGLRLPQDRVGEEIISYLNEFAERGLLLGVDELKSLGVEADRVVREERLAASSTAMTSVSVLAAIASVGLVPLSKQASTTENMCRIQIEATSSGEPISDLFPPEDSLVPGEREAWNNDYTTFLEQREDCISEIVDLYWVLLARSSSSIAAMEVFLEMMNSDDTIPETVDKSLATAVDVMNRRTQKVKCACIAVDAVSGALWGKPPDIPGIIHLRICWYNFMSALASIASRMNLWIVEVDRTWDDGSDNAIANRRFVHCALLLLLNVLVSLNRFIDEELLRGEGLLAPDEWDAIVDVLDNNLDKWLCMTDKTSAFAAETPLIFEIQCEASKLLDKLRIFFDQCVQFETSAFNLVVEDECRRMLFSLLLQKAVPYLPPEKGASLALSILRCWSATDFTIDKSDTWARTASYIITDVFSMFEDQSYGPFQGYVHSPSVRLEALRLIAFGEEDERSVLDSEHIETSEQMSPLELSLHFREQYLALVNGSLLPPLLTMFGAQASNIHVAVVLPLPVASFSATRIPLDEEVYGDSSVTGDWKQTVGSYENDLRRFAVKLLGRLYRSGTGEKFHRSSLLKMMLSAAIGNSLEDCRLSMESSAVEPGTLFVGESSTSLQAIQELGKCLGLPFRSMPNAHESLPPVVDALCSILIVHGGEPLREREHYNESWLAMKRLLAIATVLPLARLRVSHNARLILGKLSEISVLVPELVVRQLLNESNYDNVIAGHIRQNGLLVPEVAPFIIVTDESQPQNQPTKDTNETRLSFVSVLSSLLATLLTNLESRRARDRVSAGLVSCNAVLQQPVEILDSNFRSLCFDTLAEFLRGGVDFPFTKELVSILRPRASNITAAEASARCKCAASAVEYLVTRYNIAKESIDGFSDDASVFIKDLLTFCSSKSGDHVICGCQSLRGVVDFVAENSTVFGYHVVETISSRLKVEADCFRDSHAEEQAVAESLLSLLNNIVCASDEHGSSFSSTDVLVQVFDVCLDMCFLLCSLPGSKLCRELCARLVDVILIKLRTESATIELKDSILNQFEERFIDAVATTVSRAEEMQRVEVLEDGMNHCMIVGDTIARHRSKSPHKVTVPNEPLSTYHEFMARETENINRFVSEQPGLDQETSCSAWLCGKSTVLTLRLGSLESRYRGWLEVVTRSPTMRTRRMIRLPTLNSLDDPDLPSSLWEDPSKTNVRETSPNLVSDDMMNRFTEPSEEMKRAASVMEKFDAMFGQSNKGPVPLKPTHTEIVKDNTSSWGATSYRSSAVNAFQENARNIGQWLQLVLKDSAAVRCVQDELESLGFTSSLLSTTAASDVNGLDSLFLPVERLSFGSKFRRALSIVDRVPPFNTHKIALLRATDDLVGETSLTNASLEDMLLSSTSGSPKFLSFTDGLGKLVLSRHLKYYSGGLDTSGFDSDGRLSLVWLDREDAFARNMVVFHVVPFLPVGANNRKRHIGNDHIHIVYVEPGCVLDQSLRQGQLHGKCVSSLVSGEFGFVMIFIQTLAGQGRMKVSVRIREGLTDDIQSRLDHLVGEHLVSEANAPALVRRIAMQADVTCHTAMEDLLGKSNWEERQWQITAMHRHILKN